MSSFYMPQELEGLGLKKYGENVLISRNACIYAPDRLELGDNVRIDDFCVLSGTIKLHSYIHIAPFCLLAGGDVGIELEDFSGLSSRVSVYAVSDDYSGASLTNPTIDEEYKSIVSGKVMLEKHVIVGASSVVLPGVILGEGSSVGSMSLVSQSIAPWTINVGIPAKSIKARSKALLSLEKKFTEKNGKI